MAVAGACAGESRSPVAAIEDLPLIEIRETLRIGSVDDADIGFTSIGGVTVDDEGLVFVLERAAAEIRVYDDTGRLVRVIGRAGDGPGEFRSPFRIGLFGDTVWVTETSPDRITLFTRSGELIETVPLRGTESIEALPGVTVQFGVQGLRRDGTITSYWQLPAPSRPVADSFWLPWVRLGTDGAIIDTISLQKHAFGESKRVSLAGRNVSVPGAPPSAPLHVPADDGAWIIERPVAADANLATLTVTRVRMVSDTLVRRELRYSPRVFGDAFIEEMATSAAERWARTTGLDAADLVGLATSEIELPPFQPPVSLGFVASDGALWLRREDTGGPTRSWLVVSPEGEPIGTAALPQTATIQWADARSIWVSVRDELGVPWLHRYTWSSTVSTG